MNGLAGFLLARIADDERAAGRIDDALSADRDTDPHWTPGRVLAECDAKRRIVEHCEPDLLALSPGDDYVLRLIALTYADHPDYRDEWKP